MFLVTAFQVTSGWNGEEEEKDGFIKGKKKGSYNFQFLFRPQVVLGVALSRYNL